MHIFFFIEYLKLKNMFLIFFKSLQYYLHNFILNKANKNYLNKDAKSESIGSQSRINVFPVTLLVIK